MGTNQPAETRRSGVSRLWPSHPRRRAVVLVVLCAGAGAMGVSAYHARRQRQAVAAIRALGGRVTYAHELPHARLHWPLNWLASALGSDYVSPVAVVQLGRTQVQDADLVRLESLDHVIGIWLNQTAVTDEGLRSLRSMRSLQQLSIAGTRVSDKGLKQLSGLAGLEFLYLDNTEVTDEGLETLSSLVRLKRLQLSGTHLTPEGVSRLRQALPRTRITF